MNRGIAIFVAAMVALPIGPLIAAESAAPASAPPSMAASAGRLEAELVGRCGEVQRARIRNGLRQTSAFWQTQDGDAAAFEAFVRANFASDGKTLDALLDRFEHNLEQLDGHLHEVNREFRNPADLDVGPLQPYDDAFAGYDPSAHLVDDFFASKLAFTVLLNFPLTTLEERLAEGDHWTRRQWAGARLAERFAKRIPAHINQGIAQAAADSERYIAEYNIWMHHLVDSQGQRLFPAGLRLLSHWNLRDEIKAQYGDPKDGLARQHTIQRVMERIVTQEIPLVVVNNPGVDWNPGTNAVRAAPAQALDGPAKPGSESPDEVREPDTRYAMLLADFRAQRAADPYSPTAPTFIARRFDEDRQIPEARVRAMLEQVLKAPEVAETARLIAQRLGRPLEPFDIWYNGFRPRGKYTEAQLDTLVAKRYPTAAAYQKDIPRLLKLLGFSPARAQYLAGNIIVDAARGSGHAMGATMRREKARLRTRVEKSGMNYKGYNIAVHEMGHNVEQTFSLNDIDHTLLAGVPNNAFTEALAFVFQNRDLELLGLGKPDAASRALKALNDFWAAYEIAGVALLDIDVWHWMYDHPDATSAQLREATVVLARDLWNRYYAPVFVHKDVALLGIYSHMIDSFLYLPDYPLGHMIAFQIEEQMEKSGQPGREFERMATLGRVTPDQWMIHATGKPVGPEALLAATRTALARLGGAGR